MCLGSSLYPSLVHTGSLELELSHVPWLFALPFTLSLNRFPSSSLSSCAFHLLSVLLHFLFIAAHIG